MPKNATLFSQLQKILRTMEASGRKPLAIHIPYAQLGALRTEMRAVHSDIDPAQMMFFNIPLKISEPGTGLWVSCIS